MDLETSQHHLPTVKGPAERKETEIMVHPAARIYTFVRIPLYPVEKSGFVPFLFCREIIHFKLLLYYI